MRNFTFWVFIVSQRQICTKSGFSHMNWWQQLREHNIFFKDARVHVSRLEMIWQNWCRFQKKTFWDVLKKDKPWRAIRSNQMEDHVTSQLHKHDYRLKLSNTRMKPSPSWANPHCTADKANKQCRHIINAAITYLAFCERVKICRMFDIRLIFST